MNIELNKNELDIISTALVVLSVHKTHTKATEEDIKNVWFKFQRLNVSLKNEQEYFSLEEADNV